MPLRETLQRVLSDYQTSKAALLEGHPMAQFIRGEAADSVSEALAADGEGLIVHGSLGSGQLSLGPMDFDLRPGDHNERYTRLLRRLSVSC